MIVWDLGTWAPHGTTDPVAAVAAGELHADVFGHKLRGRLVLVRGDGEQWLLLHTRDAHAVAGWDPEEHPRPALSGRTNEEVRADPDRMWRSDLPPALASVPARAPSPGDTARGAIGPPGTLEALDALGAGGVWEVLASGSGSPTSTRRCFRAGRASTANRR
ncbi:MULTISPECIES: hypothetical protein [unclassified Parafrankia]|uniref:hypothetical protein n=1 Tax=unclassified Parafrankia TaxID=2994368 RepID=UPI000DA5647E